MRTPYAAVLCTAIVALTSVPRAQERPALGAVAADRPAAVPVTAAPPLNVRNEQEWIVSDIASAIQQMVAAAAGPPSAPSAVSVASAPASPAALARFVVTLPDGKRVTIPVTDHLWAPEAFAPLASSLAGGPACSGEPAAPAIAAMLDPRADAMVRESDRISTRLRTDIRCADAHHEAALLLGAFALREAAGGFSDPRRAISRMTAHLAVAHAVHPAGSSAVRQLADAVLLTLVGRQRSALDALAALETAKPSGPVLSWIRALRVRNTSDWRSVQEPQRATLLEQLSLLRARQASVGDTAALESFDAFDEPADTADWPRVLGQYNSSVQIGNRFAELWLDAELSEASRVLQATDPRKAAGDPQALVRELNAEPGPGPIGADGTLRVIDWGLWAASAQRHLLAAIVTRHAHLAKSLALPGDARAFRDDVSRTYSSLRLYPLGASAIAFNRDEASRALAAAGRLVRARPDLVTDWAWKTLHTQAKYAVVAAPADPATWFVPFFPVGTAFDTHNRPNGVDDVPRFDEKQIAALRRHAPFSRRLIFATVRWKGDKPSHEVLRQEYGDMAAYDVGFARTLAAAAWDRPEIYVPQMELVCQMSPDAYWDLAPYLADRGRVDEARRAYEQWLARGRNEVGISNSMGWLVRHYFEQGEMAEAAALAGRVADVGSFWGLVTRAQLLEWSGQLQQAERDHRTAWRRYDNPNELLAFYLRNRRTGSDVDEVMRAVFPAGLGKLESPLPTAPPLDGVLLVFAGARGMAQGLRDGDVIIAVDGIRVRNMPQYRAARGASADDRMRLTIWRGGKYFEVQGPLRYQWVVSTVKSYQPATPPPPTSSRPSPGSSIR
jgi:hypothetical protein